MALRQWRHWSPAALSMCLKPGRTWGLSNTRSLLREWMDSRGDRDWRLL